MSFGLLNALMLAGLVGLAAPVLAHLLSRRKFDVIHWGAMQFLQLGRRTRRRVRLEELLLLLMRMGLIALLVLAMCRPWAKGGWLSGITGNVSRDVVLVVDGSYSMGWEGRAKTPHASAIKWAEGLLETLRPEDTVTLIDARDQVRLVTDSPTTDRELVRDELTKLKVPAGSSNIVAAIVKGVQELGRTKNVSREVVVLTDGQRLPWRAEDAFQWTRVDDLRNQLPIPPKVWMVDVVGNEVGSRTNFSVERLELSRELTVPEFPIRVKTTIQNSSETATRRQVYFEVNGQRLQQHTQNLNLPANGESVVEFEHRFPAVGSYQVSVSLDADDLPGDDRADAAVVVTDGVPVLVVDGDPRLDPTQKESFFVQAAFAAASESPWVRATVVEASAFTSQSLTGQRCVLLLNVPRLEDTQIGAIHDFVRRGGGVIIAPGEKTDPAAWNAAVNTTAGSWMPASLDSKQTVTGRELGSLLLQNDSLKAPWLQRFRQENGVDFIETRFSEWWRLKAVELAPVDPAATVPGDVNLADGPKPAMAVAQFQTGEAYLVTRNLGAGAAVMLAGPLDGDWSTLPAKNDFLPFLHELVFALSSPQAGRNVDVGAPLILERPAEVPPDQYEFTAPDGEKLAPSTGSDPLKPDVRLPSAVLAGVYRLARKDRPEAAPELFVANFDRAESDLTPLAPADRDKLFADGRVQVVEQLSEVTAAATDDSARSEFWWMMVFAVLGLLIAETAMTRRLVQGGHAVLDEV